MLCVSYALVQATVGVGTVIIPYIGVAYTRGGGGYWDRFDPGCKSPAFLQFGRPPSLTAMHHFPGSPVSEEEEEEEEEEQEEEEEEEEEEEVVVEEEEEEVVEEEEEEEEEAQQQQQQQQQHGGCHENGGFVALPVISAEGKSRSPPPYPTTAGIHTTALLRASTLLRASALPWAFPCLGGSPECNFCPWRPPLTA